jgi:hypothetical protein
MQMTFWRWMFAAVIAAHGIAHAPGFAVSWRLMTSPEIPYHTALLGGRLTVGDTAIRALGLFWIAAGAAFVGTAVLLAVRSPYAMTALAIATLVSLVLCVLEWPYARIGLFFNLALLLMLPVAAGLLWQADTRAVEARLTAQPVQPSGANTPLPAPVARYFARVIPPGAKPIRGARLTQDAEFFVGSAWRPLSASQTFTIAPPGFVWDARIAMAPGMSVLVRDAFVAGGGSMHADFMGLYPIAYQTARAELNAGALHRYLAESVWLPTALRPESGVEWAPLTDHSAVATLSAGAARVSLEFRFNADGDIVEMFTPERFAESKGSFEKRPWTVTCSEHAVRDGYRIPIRCEVSWQQPDGPQAYWRGRISTVEYLYDDASPKPPLSSE